MNELKGMSMLNKKRQEMATKAADAHRVTLQKNLQRRLDVARASGDENLLRQLEAEASYIGLN
jgi:plasmid maintenance system killer protein